VTLDHGLEHLLERAVGLEADRPLRDGKVLQRRLVAVGAFGSLEGHRDLLRRICGAGLQRVLLPPTESSRISRKMRRTNAGSRPSRSPYDDRCCSSAVSRSASRTGPSPSAFTLAICPRQPRPFTERRHQHRIDVVETLP
jgi:hypothetical protein